ncbi:MAG: lysylphosphatidylglycerol synthase domain-containing protein [Putridiphycobacter sp.]|nr:lysylphosphatidylglycerol synthase domain-containing protein [Putridiphycobacter sp.]
MSVENSIWIKYRPSRAVLFGVKLLIGGFLLWYLWTRISDAFYSQHILDLSLGKQGVMWLLVGTTLSFANWFFEAKKWQILASLFQKTNQFIAYKSVLAGLATGLITPNRLGNFIGRLAYIDSKHHLQATINTQVGNLAQFIVTITAGLFGLSAVAQMFLPTSFVWIPIIMLIVASTLYFRPKLIIKLPLGSKLYATYSKEIDDLASLPTVLKWRVLLFSLLRYLIFIVQYICLYRVFGIETDPLLIALLSASTFLITTVIPGIFMGKLLVRESAAVFVFGWIGLPVQTIVAVSFLMWLINLALPAVFGWYFWIKKPTV